MLKKILLKIKQNIKMPDKLSKLSAKEKKMIAILVIFFAVVGYYEYILSPIVNSVEKAKSVLTEENKKLMIVNTKVSSLINLKKKNLNVAEIIKIIESSSDMPYESAPLNIKINTIVDNGNKSGVSITSIRPTSLIIQGQAGKQNTIKDKIFDIAGTGNVQSIMKYLRSLWGTEIENFNVSLESKTTSQLRFSAKIIFLPKLFDIKENRDKKYIYSEYNVKNNPFDIVKPPPPPKPIATKPPPSPPPQPIAIAVDGELLGIVEANGVKNAVMLNKKDNDLIILSEGERFNEHILKEIKKKEAVFEDKNKLESQQKLPEDNVPKINSTFLIDRIKFEEAKYEES
jgi:type II secretory pathway component PulM